MLTRIFEVFAAIGLFVPMLRPWAGIVLVLYLIAVFPANVQAARRKTKLGNYRTTAFRVMRLSAQSTTVTAAGRGCHASRRCAFSDVCRFFRPRPGAIARISGSKSARKRSTTSGSVRVGTLRAALPSFVRSV
jgi:hypothetical protein